MEESSSGHDKVLILLHWQEVTLSFLTQIHLSLKVIVLCNGTMLHLFLTCTNQGLVPGKAKYVHDRIGTQLELGKPQWDFFFSVRNWIRLKHSFILLENQTISTFQ